MKVLPLLLLVFSFAIKAQVIPLVNGHAHNDYWHIKPLQQALKNGFMSVEADVHLLKGDLLVNHEAAFTRKGRTLEKLYLKPLFEKAKANNFSSVFENGPKEFILYIDIKQGCPWICDTLISQLKQYEKMLTVWEDGVKKTGAVSVIIGACGQEEKWVNSSMRWFYFDAHFDALDGLYDSDVIPRVSTNFSSVSKWRGVGEIPDQDLKKMREMIQRAHDQGRKVRFWAASQNPKVWNLLLKEGVDWINVDRLGKFRRFALNRKVN